MVRRPPFSKIFFSKTAGPVKAKFHMEPQWDGGTKVCSQGLFDISCRLFDDWTSRMEHYTWPRWPPRPYMVKTLQKSSSPEPKGQWSCGLVCSIGDSGPIIVCSNDDPRLTLTYFTARSNLVPYAFIWGKTVRKSFNEKNTYSKWPEWQKGLC